MWTPYFLSKVGFGAYSSTVSIMYPLMSCLSTLVSYSFTYCSNQVEKCLAAFFTFILGFEVCLLTLGDDQNDLVWYFICFGGIGLLVTPALSWVNGYQGALITEGNPILRNQVYFFENLARQLVALVWMLGIGYLGQ